MLKIVIAVMMFAVIGANVFAAGVLPAGMENLAIQILDVFTGTFMRTILIIMLCGCAVAYVFNKDNEKVKRNVIALGVAIAILVAASSLVQFVFTAAA
jgi:type IV secretory pathway VirB2 component (pilin)